MPVMTAAAVRLALLCILVPSAAPAAAASTFCHEDGRPWKQWEAGPDRYYRLFETPQLWPEADRQVKWGLLVHIVGKGCVIPRLSHKLKRWLQVIFARRLASPTFN